jgi:hypothetical protein
LSGGFEAVNGSRIRVVGLNGQRIRGDERLWLPS